MSPEEVTKRILEIVEITDDDEAAHSAEDCLYLDILKAIAEGKCRNPKLCAELAVKTQELEFARWCA